MTKTQTPPSTDEPSTAPSAMESRFLRLTIFNVVANLTVPLAGVVDSAMLGHLPEIRFLAGVALASLIFDYIYFGLGFLRMATTGTTAQAAGRDDHQEVVDWLYRGLGLAISCGVLVVVLSPLIESVGFRLLAGEAAVESAGREYFAARIWGAPATLANLVLAGWFLGRGHGAPILLLTATTNAANIALNYWFIVVLGLAARGAGLATMLAQYAGLGLAVVVVVSRFELSPPQLGRTFRGQEMARLLRLNLDILVRTLMLVSAFALFTNFSALFGTVVLTANAILLRIVSIASYLIDGVAHATESVAGHLLGAGRSPRLPALLRRGLGSGLALSSLVLVPMLAFPRAVLDVFTHHQAVIQAALDSRFWLLPVILFGVFAYVYDGFFLGLTEGPLLRRAMVVSAGLVFLPLVLLAAWFRDHDLLWFSLAALMAARATTLGWAARKWTQTPDADG